MFWGRSHEGFLHGSIRVSLRALRRFNVWVRLSSMGYHCRGVLTLGFEDPIGTYRILRAGLCIGMFSA